MSLEAKLEALTVVMERNNELLETIVKGKAGGAAADASDKKPATRSKAKVKAEDAGEGDGEGSGEGDAVDASKLKKLIDLAKGWLTEFSENEEDPENEARSEKLTAALEKLGVEKLSKITTEDERGRAETWVKKQIAAGRITEEPAPKGKGKSKGDDDDI